MYREIVKCKNPKILVITPLKPGDKISRETRISIKRTKTPYVWISYEGKNNPAKNTQLGFDAYRLKYDDLPPYVIKMDNDINANRGMLDKMFRTLSKAKLLSNGRYGYAYCNFAFKGAVNKSFQAEDFNVQKLLQHNYISFNSLISTEALLYIGGFVTDDKYFRLLDWCLWLKMLFDGGFIGIPVYDTYFVAYASEKSVSARDINDYKEKHQAVFDDFIRPEIEKLKEEQEKIKNEDML